MSTSWLARLLSPFRRPAHAAAPRRPRLEALEDRLAPASSLLFSLHPSYSSLSLSGSALGATLTPQGLGALTTRFAGTVRAEVDLDANTIRFLQGGTSLDAQPTGFWDPLPGGGRGAALADYAAMLNVSLGGGRVAARDLVASLSTTGSIALSGDGPDWTFASDQTVSLVGGFADYRATGLASALVSPGRVSLAGRSAINAAADGTLLDLGGGAYRLILPINVTVSAEFNGQSASLSYSGTLTATAAVPTVDLNGPADGADTLRSYLEGDGPRRLAGVTVVTGGTLGGATITLTGRPDGVAERLAVSLGSSGLRSSGYDPATGTITLRGLAPAATYQQVIRTLTYSNTSTSPTELDRTVLVKVSNGNESLERAVTIAVTDSPGDPFVVAAKTYRGVLGRALRVRAAGLLAGLVPVDGGTPRARVETPPAARFGQLTVNADGSFTFTPRGRPAAVRFTARLFDGAAWSAAFEVTLLFR